MSDVRIRYDGERDVTVPTPGTTLLAASLANGIPHIHACGGNARCSTCRVVVLEGGEHLSPRTSREQVLAGRKGLEADIRLACQAQVLGNVTVRRLVRDGQDIDLILGQQESTTGKEMEVTVLFCDIRGFTTFSEASLPYDVVHLLNRYFKVLGDAVLKHHGSIDKYIGDAIMAIFGLSGHQATDAGALNAVQAALEMLDHMEDFNHYLKQYFDTVFRIGIGIHTGVAVVGELGHPIFRQFTAIGDTVNLASRLEGLNKAEGTQLLISEAVYHRIGSQLDLGRQLETPIRGKSGTHLVYEVTGLKQPPRPTLEEALDAAVTRATAPGLLHLAFHDAGTWDPQQQAGGANGSIRLDAERTRRENLSVQGPFSLLSHIKDSFAEVSWADLIAMAGAVSVQKCNGPPIQIDRGRIDSDTPAPEGLLPDDTITLDGLEAYQRRLDLSDAELVALMGAHTLGRHKQGPITDDPWVFDNDYYKVLLDPLRASQAGDADRLLTDHPSWLLWVQRFADDQAAFFTTFAAAYVKLTAPRPVAART